MMKRMRWVFTFALLPASAAAQQDPVERLALVLPEEIAQQVIDRVEAARARDLPVQAAANLALEGVAKGRSAEEVLAAVELLVGDMGNAQQALHAAGRTPEVGEVEAATAAMRMGVDGAAISELARYQPSGRTLAVPLLVLGGLAARDLPSDEAIAAVRARLEAKADDATILGDLPVVVPGLGRGGGPGQVGPALASSLTGFQVPVAGVNVPVGPQGENPRPPIARGRGAGPGGA